MTTRSTKRALVASILVLSLCFSALIGTTFAWFTDSVTSSGNNIVSGTLKVDLEVLNKDNGAWTSVKETNGSIFNYQYWEPGFVDAKVLKVENEGSLALKWKAVFTSNTALSELADVIDVYVYNWGVLADASAVAYPADRNLDDYTLVGTLGEFIATIQTTTYGELKAGEAAYLGVALKMREEAGNEYQGLDLGGAFDIRIVATQQTYEGDSFGTDYDEEAWDEGIAVFTATDLKTAVESGENVTLMDDIVLSEPIVITSGTSTFSMRSTPAAQVINLNGNTITAAYDSSTDKHAYAINNYGNLEIVGGTIEARGIYNQDGASLTVNGTKIVNLDTNGGSCIWSYGGSVVLNDAELVGYTGCVYSQGYLEINGGTYTCYAGVLDDGTQVGPTYNIRSYGELVINDGDFTSRHGLVAAAGNAVINGGTYTMTSIGTISSHVIYVFEDGIEVTVNGGEFNCDLRTAQANGSSMVCVDAVDADVNINGGTFNHKSFENYVADGYTVIENSEGSYVVAVSDAAAFEAALEDENIREITLGNDITLTNVAKVSTDKVIYLNGFNFVAKTGSRPFHVYGADLTIDATGSNVQFDQYGLVDIKEGDVKISITGGTFTGALNNGAVIKGRTNTKAEIYFKDVNMSFTDSSTKGSYVYNPDDKYARGVTTIDGGVYNIDCGFIGNVVMKNATVNAKGFVFNGGGSIENCTLTTDGSSKAPADAAPFCCVAASNNRTVTVKNSTLTATNCNAIEIYPTGGIVIVTDSTVTGNCYKHPLYDANDNCSIIINGVEQ